MSNWSTYTLGELVSIQKGKNVETSDQMKDGYLPYLGASSLDGKIKFFASKEGALVAQRSDILMLWDGERSGLVGYNLFGVVASTVSKLAPSGLVDTKFLYYLLSLNFNWIQQNRTGTGVPHVPKDISKILKLKIPDCILNQQKIAKVLSTIDNQIEQTQALIEKYTAIKQGLMSDLFSRGIDINTGKLRQSYQQAPELYWESELGWIPKDWNAPLLDKFAKRNSGHTPAKTISEYWNGGIKWVSLADSNKLDKLYITATRFEVSQLGIQNSSAIELPKGTVILSRDAGIGKSAILAKRMAVSQHFMAWTCKKSSSNLFLYYWLQNMKPVFEQVAMGSTIPTIGLDFFKRLQIACPDNIEEQENIGLKLKELDLLILKFKNEKQKSQSQKQGLMQDLLTGKKSVDSLPDNILTPTSPSQAIAQL